MPEYYAEETESGENGHTFRSISLTLNEAYHKFKMEFFKQYENKADYGREEKIWEGTYKEKDDSKYYFQCKKFTEKTKSNKEKEKIEMYPDSGEGLARISGDKCEILGWMCDHPELKHLKKTDSKMNILLSNVESFDSVSQSDGHV